MHNSLLTESLVWKNWEWMLFRTFAMHDEMRKMHGNFVYETSR
jgi:hypothetical protein